MGNRTERSADLHDCLQISETVVEPYSPWSKVEHAQLSNKGFQQGNRAIGIINFERRSPNFIADTMNWFLNSMLD